MMASLCLKLVKNASILRFNSTNKQLLAISRILKYQTADLQLKVYRDPDYKRPPAFPYKTKVYGLIAGLFDRTIWRFEENTKLIVVEGPPASGKTKVAKDIAEAFDLHYMPPFNLDHFFVNDYGYDLRQMNDQLPFSCRSFDICDFLKNPHDPRSMRMHLQIYEHRLLNYVEGLAHMLNTGQGVVMDTCVYGDKVYSHTYTEFGYYAKTFSHYMDRAYEAIFYELLKPHVVIYLDQSVDETIKRIKERNLPGEENSPVYEKDVLSLLEYNYKKYIGKIGTHAESLIYNWNEERDSELIIEDLENVNLDEYLMNDPKMRDWRTPLFEEIWLERRRLYTNERDYFKWWSSPVDTSCPEVYSISGQEMWKYNEVVETAPGMEFETGFNSKMGDNVNIFK